MTALASLATVTALPPRELPGEGEGRPGLPGRARRPDAVRLAHGKIAAPWPRFCR